MRRIAMSQATNEVTVILESTTETDKADDSTTSRRKRTITPLIYQLVEVVKDGDGPDNVIFVPLPVPEGTDMSGKTPIIRAVTAAAAKGDESYDGKHITVIAYPKPVKLTAKPITVKRKVTFNL
jgi:hypothetical protein